VAFAGHRARYETVGQLADTRRPRVQHKPISDFAVWCGSRHGEAAPVSSVSRATKHRRAAQAMRKHAGAARRCWAARFVGNLAALTTRPRETQSAWLTQA